MNQTEQGYAITRVKEIGDRKRAENNKNISKKYLSRQEQYSAIKHKQAKLRPLAECSDSSMGRDWFIYPAQEKLDKEYEAAKKKQDDRKAAVTREQNRLTDLIRLGSPKDAIKMIADFEKF